MLKIVIHKRISAGAGRIEITETWHRNGTAVRRLYEEARLRVSAGRPIAWQDVDRAGLSVNHEVSGKDVELLQLFEDGREIASSDR